MPRMGMHGGNWAIEKVVEIVRDPTHRPGDIDNVRNGREVRWHVAHALRANPLLPSPEMKIVAGWGRAAEGWSAA